MKIELLHHTPLWVCSKAIRKCWASEDKSDTEFNFPNEYSEPIYIEDYCEDGSPSYNYGVGPKDKELIYRVGNKNKHSSTLEHLNYNFDCDGISRACLQEVARHRHTSISVKSTRYTLKELKNTTYYDEFLIKGLPIEILQAAVNQLKKVQIGLNEGIPNDQAKYMLPEAYKTSFVWTINARSLQNFLSLRTDKSALWEIREFANAVYKQLPEEHKYLFTEFVKEVT